jgi:hypothetical protein
MIKDNELIIMAISIIIAGIATFLSRKYYDVKHGLEIEKWPNSFWKKRYLIINNTKVKYGYILSITYFLIGLLLLGFEFFKRMK